LLFEPKHDRTHASQAEWSHNLLQTHIEIEVVVNLEDCLGRLTIEPGGKDAA
jgi:hypothetical protein